VGRLVDPPYFVMPARLWFVLLAICSCAPSAFAVDWRPIAPDELALKQSKTDPNADAEALFRDVSIEYHFTTNRRTVTTNYIRIKVFNARGIEKFSKVKIVYNAKHTFTDLTGRTIHPDGSVVELPKDAIFDTVETKRGNYTQKASAFVLPSVEPGSIIEYRWKITEDGFISNYISLPLQTEYPVDEVTFRIKLGEDPFSPHAQMRFLSFHCTPERGQDEKGSTVLTVRNVPAYHDEPHSPRGLSGKQWILVDYERDVPSNAFDYWPQIGQRLYNEAKERIKVNSEMKKTAAEIVSTGKTDEEKLALLADYCQKNITNVYGNNPSPSELKKVVQNATTAQVFHDGQGTPLDISYVFIALARAAGFDARPALLSNRIGFVFTPEIQSRYFVNDYRAAVYLNDGWKLYNVNDRILPPGVMHWYEQGVFAFVPDAANSIWFQTPLLSAAETKSEHAADLKLSIDGDLEGDVHEFYYGNEGIIWRQQHSKQNDAEREEFIRSALKRRFSDFEVTNIHVQISPEAKRPVGVNYHLLVKGYAQRTGKRLFFRPGFFNAGNPAVFTAAERTNLIEFDFPWSQSDNVDIHLPPGFELDHPAKPAPQEIPNVGKYAVNMSIEKSSNTLLYRRSFSFGEGALPVFPAKVYPTLKAFFDQVHSNDEYMLTLKIPEAQPSSPSGQ
jgi:hypothetical protein